MRLRYSLGELLILIAALSVPIGWWADHNRMRRECDYLARKLVQSRQQLLDAGIEIQRADRQLQELLKRQSGVSRPFGHGQNVIYDDDHVTRESVGRR